MELRQDLMDPSREFVQSPAAKMFERPQSSLAGRLRLLSSVPISTTDRVSRWVRILAEQHAAAEGLAPAWVDLIVPLVWSAVETINLNNAAGDAMNILNYVKVKKHPGGDMAESTYIEGLVFTKNIAHKRMRGRIESPSILVLSNSIEFQRAQDKVVSPDVRFCPLTTCDLRRANTFNSWSRRSLIYPHALMWCLWESRLVALP